MCDCVKLFTKVLNAIILIEVLLTNTNALTHKTSSILFFTDFFVRFKWWDKPHKHIITEAVQNEIKYFFVASLTDCFLLLFSFFFLYKKIHEKCKIRRRMKQHFITFGFKFQVSSNNNIWNKFKTNACLMSQKLKMYMNCLVHKKK